VGELIDVIVKEVEASNQSNSQGTADADVQAILKELGTDIKITFRSNIALRA